jgi:hypothetical protein
VCVCVGNPLLGDGNFHHHPSNARTSDFCSTMSAQAFQEHTRNSSETITGNVETPASPPRYYEDISLTLSLSAPSSSALARVSSPPPSDADTNRHANRIRATLARALNVSLVPQPLLSDLVRHFGYAGLEPPSAAAGLRLLTLVPNIDTTHGPTR